MEGPGTRYLEGLEVRLVVPFVLPEFYWAGEESTGGTKFDWKPGPRKYEWE